MVVLPRIPIFPHCLPPWGKAGNVGYCGALGTASFGDIKFGGTVMEFVFTHPDYEGHSFRFATDLDGDRDTIHAEVTELAGDGEKRWDYCGTIDGKADPVTSVNRIFAAIAKWDK